ncbi:hypothetical protein PR003_g7454 [Phytophthora rubi]|uniref:Uncharacterized protein n=1 Tax=Phytophthora rubi TaxID=129364 RepID=A0A6A4FTW0_9STRA|nr:hypothetical protein PR001_g3835 [Phytophthora rubi]KAE9346387.1 hypothetical protein PR003_g7454 [Phytophthora rubi]
MQAQPVPVNYAASNRALGKRKGREEVARPKKGGECFYCEGRYNRDGESHRKGTRVQTQAKSVGVAHVKGATAGSKKKAKTQRQEIPAEVALLQPISKMKIAAAVKALMQETGLSGSPTLTLEQAQRDADVFMTSPPASPAPSSSSLDSSASDGGDDMDEHDPGCIPVHAAKLKEAPSNIKKASEEIENTVRNLYPELLQRDETDITRSDWV